MMAVRLELATLFLFLAATCTAAFGADTAGPDVCHFIAKHQAAQSWMTEFPPAYGPRSEFLNDYFVRYGWVDLDGDGIADHVTRQQMTGTMGGDAYDTTLSSVGKASPKGDPATALAAGLPESLAKYLDDNRLNFGEAFLPFKGRFYDVHFQDEGGAFVLDALYYQRGGVQRAACVFKNHVTILNWSPSGSPPQFKADEDVVLRRAGEREIADNPVTASSRLAKTAPAAGYSLSLPGGLVRPACAFKGTGCKDVWNVDFDNDGTADRLLLLSGNSSAGRGCDLSYFMALTPDGNIAKGARQDLLLKLQNVRLDDAYPVRPCEMEFRWLKVAGRIVLERRSAQQPPRNSSELVDDLWIARGDQTARLAHATFKVAPEIIYDAAAK